MGKLLWVVSRSERANMFEACACGQRNFGFEVEGSSCYFIWSDISTETPCSSKLLHIIMKTLKIILSVVELVNVPGYKTLESIFMRHMP